LAPGAAERFAEIMKTDSVPVFSLVSGLKEESDDFAGAFAQALEQSYSRDCARGMTTVGPHRGDVSVELDGQPARQFASQGQQRALVLSLKLAEVALIATQLDCSPILLLDDVSSELDAERTKMLFSAIESLAGQVWLSTTGAAPLPIGPEAQLLDVVAGRVLAAAGS